MALPMSSVGSRLGPHQYLFVKVSVNAAAFLQMFSSTQTLEITQNIATMPGLYVAPQHCHKISLEGYTTVTC